MKNEFRSTWKFMAAIFAAFVLLTIFGGNSVRILNNASHPGVLPILTLMLYVMSFFVVFFGILIFLCNRYYKTMYSTQGYLTHTLPATENSIFFAKVLVSVIWMLCGILLMMGSIYVMGDIGTEGELSREVHHVWSTSGITVDEDGTHVQIDGNGIVVDDGDSHVSITASGIIVNDGSTSVEIIEPGLQDKNFERIINHPKRTSWFFIIWLLINMILGSGLLLLWIFASMAIGQLSDKHRTLVSILSGIGFYILNQLIGVSAIISFVTKAENWVPYQVFKTVVYGAPLYLLFLCAILATICQVINHKKLNLA